ncbi:hypothetical protein CHARACLAT_004757, partial [Characodon lateralis]|nr:hypothetical protein [Characodon lateralis]
QPEQVSEDGGFRLVSGAHVYRFTTRCRAPMLWTFGTISALVESGDAVCALPKCLQCRWGSVAMLYCWRYCT